eukprot:NODE_2253_length_1250_cov_27.280600_g2052_i0.p1 GENE.NODE_2253_length_1250_cov_27.280600_g2052_i0~~NODE_2253_length_1250_cov_27.280600_g2052_i0.p1  ORF type:complete len:138 (+),score=18.23 NODE_2253_length_1250_cov_27.280600_g2052_i0:331-744(+)
MQQVHSFLMKVIPLTGAKQVTKRTICNRLLQAGLPSRKAQTLPFLRPEMHMKRVAFAKQFASWTAKDWKKVYHVLFLFQIWAMMKRRLAETKSPTADFETLKAIWTEEVSKHGMALAGSVPERCAAVLAASGGPTRY